MTRGDLTNAQARKLKALAQKLEAQVHYGKLGLTEGFLKGLNEMLEQHELVKVHFAAFKDQRKELAPQLAEKTGAIMVTLVGNVVVLFRRHPDPAKQKVRFD